MSNQDVQRHYLNSAQAADHLGVSRSMLAKCRLSGDGPRYSKLGKRVVYALPDLDAWVAAGKRNSTSDPGQVAPHPK